MRSARSCQLEMLLEPAVRAYCAGGLAPLEKLPAHDQLVWAYFDASAPSAVK